MIGKKQVEAAHYDFGNYMSKPRWNSVWHQLDELIRLRPENVLEIGPGTGLLKQAASSYGISIETLDLDPDLKPDYVASVTEMPFEDGQFDLVCAFQMLEHLPYDVSLKAFAEMSRVAANTIVISLPDVKPRCHLTIAIPGIGRKYVSFPIPFHKPRPHIFDGEHHWEINKAGYELDRVVRDLSKSRTLRSSYRVPENPYHRFFIFS